MMKTTRKLYFLRDVLSGLYYTDKSITLFDWSGCLAVYDPERSNHTFENAVVYLTEIGAKSGVKRRCTTWRRSLTVTDEYVKRIQWTGVQRDLARARVNLPNFGIQIVEATVTV